MLSMLADIKAGLPAILRREEAGARAFTFAPGTSQPTCMSTVLSQELDRCAPTPHIAPSINHPPHFSTHRPFLLPSLS